MTSIVLLQFYIIGCIFALLVWNIYLYEVSRGNINILLRKLKCDKKIILSILFSWLTVIIQFYKIKNQSYNEIY